MQDQNVQMLKAIENRILFKKSLLTLTEGEIKELEGEMDAIRQFLKNSQNELADALQTPAENGQH